MKINTNRCVIKIIKKNSDQKVKAFYPKLKTTAAIIIKRNLKRIKD